MKIYPQLKEHYSKKENVENGRYDYCFECNHVKPERTHHCSKCNRCYLKYDHHCPWIANCIGLKNHKNFYVFLWLSCISTMIISITLIYPIVQLFRSEKVSSYVFSLFLHYQEYFIALTISLFIALTFAVGTLLMIITHTYIITNNVNSVAYYRIVFGIYININREGHTLLGVLGKM